MNIQGLTGNKASLINLPARQVFDIKIKGADTATPPAHSWVRVQRNFDHKWVEMTEAGSLTVDPAYEYGGGKASTNAIVEAFRHPATGEVIFRKGGDGGGQVDIESNETVLLILNDWTLYQDCPDAPPDPPMTYADPPCNESRTTTPCVPAYAFAAYYVCGHKLIKFGDSRTFQCWAYGLNGESTSSWYRFVIPRWGGDRDPVTGLPDPASDCMGVKFVPATVGALSVSCPPWLADLECLKIRVKWIAEPASKPVDCPQACWDLMEGLWGTEEETEITNFASCILQGDLTSFPVTMTWQPIAEEDCFWGPAEYDPCKPYDGFGKVVLSINSTSVTGCGSGGNAWMGWRIDENAIKNLICDCDSGPIRFENAIDPAGPCGQLAEWVEIECCTPT